MTPSDYKILQDIKRLAAGLSQFDDTLAIVTAANEILNRYSGYGYTPVR